MARGSAVLTAPVVARKKQPKKQSVSVEILKDPAVVKEKAWVSELREILRKEGGICQPEVVLEYARNPKSRLHSKFEWNDSKGAHQWRLLQARQLMRVAVYYEQSVDREIPVFVSLTRDRYKYGGGYRSMVDVLSDAEMRAELLERARLDLLGFRQRYAELTELAEVFAAIDNLR